MQLEVHRGHRHHSHHGHLRDDHRGDGESGLGVSADHAHGRAQLEWWLAGSRSDGAAGGDERVGSQPDRCVQRGTDEEDRGEQPRPGVPVESEPLLGGVFGGADHQRAEHGTERRREHDPAHRPASLVGLGEVGRRVAGKKVRRLAVPEHEQPNDEQSQRLDLDTDSGDDTTDGGRAVAEYETGPAAPALHSSGQHLRHQRRAHRDHRCGGAGPWRVLTQHVLDHERADRHRARQGGSADDLAGGQGSQRAALQLRPVDRVQHGVRRYSAHE